jgi:RluA family pseudouridine synthase
MSQPAPIQVIFIDAALLVINKPAGLSTLPDGYNPSLPYVKSLLEHQFGALWTVHRLDKNTSGVLLFARTAEAHRSLNTQFEQHTVAKLYHALVAGVPTWQAQTVDSPLRPNADRHHRTQVDYQAGKPAVTHFKVLERFEHFCLLEARPETGRTHQIRAHLASHDLSILGDSLYAPKNPPGIDQRLVPGVGMTLHAKSLTIIHPVTGEGMVFEAPYPFEWGQLLLKLRPVD